MASQPKMSTALTTNKRPQGGKAGKKSKSKIITEWDRFGRTSRTQVLHIDLFYADGTTGIINVTSPGIIWGEDIETQWFHMRTYIKSQCERLGLVGYHAHAHQIDGEGNITKSFSWIPFDLIQNKEVQL